MAKFTFTIVSKTSYVINPNLQRSMVNNNDVNLLSYTRYDLYQTNNDVKIKGSDIKSVLDVTTNTLTNVPNLSKTSLNVFGLDTLSYDTVSYTNKITKDYNFNI